MKQIKKKLPIGIENFAKLQAEDFYYVDKTMLIKELLDNWAEVNLFTRPRRFGKTLNMSMLKAFFELNGDKNCFKGTRISREVYLCEQYMGKFPVIFISLKSISAQTYEKACDMAIQIVNGEARRFQYLLDSEHLTEYDKDAFKSLLLPDMKESVLCSSLRILSELLEKHHGQKVILLIDEYDVPLAKAFELGYYNSMTLLIRNLFENALKTNDSLKFAVLTGCMRISKESIFTGLNNLKVLSVADVQFDEYFGFTDSDVKNILEYYELSEHYDEIKMWYDGYRFGNVEVYCPWDVINYCDELRINNMAQPQNYWSNTRACLKNHSRNLHAPLCGIFHPNSVAVARYGALIRAKYTTNCDAHLAESLFQTRSSSNEAVKRFIQETDKGTVRKEIEKLIAGETIVKEIHQELTYQDMYASIENLWSVLFTTGYLTQTGRKDANTFMLTIPNMEIRNIFLTQIMEYFKKTVSENGEALEKFCNALKDGNSEVVEQSLNNYLKRTISIRDTFVKKQMKENFYHGILLGILGFQQNWSVSLNKESGDGYSDILIETEDQETGIIIEIKYAETGNLEAVSEDALKQIEDRRYEDQLLEEGVEHILKYGIAFYKKKYTKAAEPLRDSDSMVLLFTVCIDEVA